MMPASATVLGFLLRYGGRHSTTNTVAAKAVAYVMHKKRGVGGWGGGVVGGRRGGFLLIEPTCTFEFALMLSLKIDVRCASERKGKATRELQHAAA